LDKATRDQINRGQRIIEILKQPAFAPVALEKQAVIIFAVVNGYLDDIPLNKIKDFENRFELYMETAHSEIMKEIATKKELTPDLE
ncbi:MAG: F0F1 ATP synthase subunit alpha, partial [Dehalococcoidales bacterium]|nr:F0F1 ATP synthase subunit alpha [Dehalococcoidales bacterium]